MPITLAGIGGEKVIARVTGKPEIRRHLENLGLISGRRVTVISRIGENLILGVQGSRLALSREMARWILVMETERGNGYGNAGSG